MSVSHEAFFRWPPTGLQRRYRQVRRWRAQYHREEISMRKIDDHKINPANDLLDISVLDEPGASRFHAATIAAIANGS